MKVYIVTEMYRDYDEGWDNIVSVHASQESALRMRNAVDMAKELEYTGESLYRWQKENYHKHEYSIEEFEVEP